ncbi:protein TolA [Sulfuriferula sp. AH1]|uniref:cell envelope integrity protein TolA n=1 Tax=Sulfuriferula sp. AH1 TaxID=1985873 RepID=UPI000B3B43DB|nr:cell envelope integrity protein TolA [Sulfuriferula sp. AH1]ARU32047.1 protein TolA [Sulfuriferula sp. AH1]
MRNTAATRGRIPAAVLAILVHLVFIALLVYSVNWKTHAPEPVMVELWQPPPVTHVQPVVIPKPPVEIVSKPEPTVPKPDIALAEKKRKLAEQQAREEALLAQQKLEQQKLEQQKLEQQKAQQKLAEQKQAEQKAVQQKAEQQKIEQQKKQAALRQLIANQMQSELKTESAHALTSSRQAALASKKAAEQSSMRAEYQEKIKAKIRSQIRYPEDLQGNPQARFEVSVLPTGDVVHVKLLRPSGQPAYDNAVERAILKASPLPMPPDSALVNEFRDLDLKFSPNEN